MPKSKATDMTAEQKAALRAYALRNGRFWKRRLWAAWIDGADAKEPEGAVLRQIRNTHGPSLLTRIGLSSIDPHREDIQHARDNHSLRLSRPPHPKRL